MRRRTIVNPSDKATTADYVVMVLFYSWCIFLMVLVIRAWLR